MIAKENSGKSALKITGKSGQNIMFAHSDINLGNDASKKARASLHTLLTSLMKLWLKKSQIHPAAQEKTQLAVHATFFTKDATAHIYRNI